MANFILEAVVTPGDEAAADEIAGVKWQMVKLTLGNVGVNNGPVSATNPLPVTGTVAATLSEPISIDDNGGSITVDGSVSISGSVDTELPAAAALSDTTANPTAPMVGAANMLWDSAGTQWQRWQSDGLGGALVAAADLFPVRGSTAPDLPLTVFPITTGARASTSPPTPVSADGDVVNLWASREGALHIVGGPIEVFTDAGSVAITGTVSIFGGNVAHDDPAATSNPLLMGGYANATAPADVSANVDAVRAWFLRNGAQATVITAAGALIGGDATNGLDVDVTRVQGTVTTQDTSSLVDNAAFTDGTSRVIPGGHVFDEVAGTALTENDIAASRIDSKRAQVMVIEDHTTRGQRVSVAATGALAVAGVVIHDSGATGTNPLLVGGYSSAAAPGNVSTDGDAVRSWFLPNGAQAVVLTAAGALIPGDATNGLRAQVGGLAAHDAPVSGNPLLSGYEARTTNGTPVASGDTVRGQADTLGKQVALSGATHDMWTSGTGAFTNDTAADVLGAAGASNRIVVTKVAVTNISLTTPTKVEIRDGTTVKLRLDADIAGGFVIADGAPIFIGTANTAVSARCVTSGADVDVFIAGYVINN